ncbi:MAG: porin family protein [Desulfobulbaceae bacterium]|nr:porin family protein [Desulfobulbaceae bacterium]
MKKQILTIACCAALLSVSSIAYSAEGLYMSGNVGLAIANDSDVTDPALSGFEMNFESDSGVAFSGAIGNSFSNYVRLEAEIAYQKNDMDKASILGFGFPINGDTSSTALLFNGYFDFVNKSAFTPYISGGMGFANVDISDTSIPGFGPFTSSGDDTVFAYQFGVGLGYAVNDKVTLDLKYRYFGTADLEIDTTEVEYSSHNIYAGIRFNL